MGRGSTGAKSGLVAGIIYGIILSVLTEIILFAEKTTIMAVLDVYASDLSNSVIKITASQLYSAEVTLAPVGIVIEGIIGGLVLGGIFGLSVNKIPGKNDKVKGMVFGIILWIIFDVLIGLGSRSEYGNTYFVLSVIAGLLAVIIYGYLLGLLFNRWWVDPEKIKQNETFTFNN
jgi:hypothetical protein